LNKDIGRYFGIRGPEVGEVIKGIERRKDKERGVRKEIECFREK
jgi:hypothetical protein